MIPPAPLKRPAYKLESSAAGKRENLKILWKSRSELCIIEGEVLIFLEMWSLGRFVLNCKKAPRQSRDIKKKGSFFFIGNWISPW